MAWNPAMASCANAKMFAHLLQGEIGHHQAAEDEHDHLDHVGVADDFHAADCDDRGEQRQAKYDGQQRLAAQKLADGHGAQKQDRSQIHEHVQEQPEHRHDQRDGFVVALLQKLRHRVDAVLQIDRHEKHADDDQRHGGDPFECRHGDADREALTRHADELLGRDVRRDERGADGPPGEGAFGQEEVGRRCSCRLRRR